MTRARATPFPDPSAVEDGDKVIARWEAVLARAPRLRPWLEQMIARRRVLLHESARGSIEEALWIELEAWVKQFEALPQFAVSAISTTLEEEKPQKAPPLEPEAPARSPEHAIRDHEALLADPAFALAFHCVEEVIRPALPAAPPDWAWFGLLHASAKPQALLSAEVAVGLVLRLLGGEWQRLPASSRQAALRLFHATAGDLRAASRIGELCSALPWSVSPEEFVQAAAALRSALSQACALCARLAASARPIDSGGLSVLAVDRARRATPAEVSRVAETARKFRRMQGLQKLLRLFCLGP